MLKIEDCLKSLRELLTDQAVICAFGAVGNRWRVIGEGIASLYSCGAMGQASSIGLGVALAMPERRVVVLDGDGAVLLNLGSLATIARQRPANLIHLVFENRLYESGGGQPIVAADRLDFSEVAQGAGLKEVRVIHTMKEFSSSLKQFLKGVGPFFGVVKVAPGGAIPEEPGADYVREKLSLMEKLRRR